MTGDETLAGALRAPARAPGRLAVGRLVLAAVLGAGCASAEPPPVAATEVAALEPPACAIDEVREYRCDALLPRKSALPAPAPYETCPAGIEVRDAVFPPASGLGRFDAPKTERARRRAPPGTQCCYSWCGKLTVVEPSAVVDRCRSPLSFHESYCVPELESGSHASMAAAPYAACPAAIRPPEGAAFSIPTGALFDRTLTGARRRARDPLCCYDWCSIAPPGSQLERTRH